MQFFVHHFNKHHFIHEPHRWFLALLISPIHFAEMHYKNKYHLNFVHAKKLFVFDMTLLCSIVGLLITTIFWFTYNPTVTSLVYLNIQPSSPKIASGEYVEYNINYNNNSDVNLTSPVLQINLPVGFVIKQAEPNEKFNNNSFTLDTITPKQSGGVMIGGWIYGTPDQDDYITATLSYKQEHRQKAEQKSTLLIKTLRGSVLTTSISMRQTILPHDSVPLTINITNQGTQILNNISIPLPNTSETKFSSPDITDNTWYIEKLEPQQTLQLVGTLTINLTNYTDKISINLTPSIKINNKNIPQKTIQTPLTIVRPQASLQVYWQNNLEKILPNEIAQLAINLKNTGNTILKNNQIELPIPTSIINTSQLVKQNIGSYRDGMLIIKINDLPIGQEISTVINIPITSFPQGGTDILLSLNPKLKAEINNIAGITNEFDSESPKIKVGTGILFQPEIRYYTAEGDQLGRGPLPPQIDKETKYWALINISNGSSKISNVKLSALLPTYIKWTGKTSVTRGSDVTYDPISHKIFWSTNSLTAYEKTGINFELSLTPTQNQINTTPLLLENIDLSATDTFTEAIINKSFPNLDISLPNDEIGRNKGVKVE